MPGRFERHEVVNGLVTLDGALVASTEKPPSGTRSIAQLKEDLPLEGERFRLSSTEAIEAPCFGAKNAVQSNAIEVDGTRVMDREPLKYPPATRTKPTVVAGLVVDNLQGPTPSKTRIDDVAFDVQLAK